MQKLLIALAIGLTWLVAPASANTIANFSLDKVTFSGGGTAIGTFTLDLTTSTLSNVNITTSMDSVSVPFSDFGTTYTDTGGRSFFNGVTTSFQFTQVIVGVVYTLGLNVGGPLTALNLAGSPSFGLVGFSETETSDLCEGQCGTRTINGGSLDVGVSATPLPATLPLFAGGLGLLGYLSRRRRQASRT
jgi:hypothetical protein